MKRCNKKYCIKCINDKFDAVTPFLFRSFKVKCISSILGFVTLAKPSAHAPFARELATIKNSRREKIRQQVIWRMKPKFKISKRKFFKTFIAHKKFNQHSHSWEGFYKEETIFISWWQTISQRKLWKTSHKTQNKNHKK